MRIASQSVLDRVSIGVSVLCALHCAVLPILLAIFPTLVVLPFEDHVFHELMIWIVIPFSIVAVFLGCRRHKDRGVLFGAGLGLTTLVLNALFGHDLLGEAGEKLATLAAAVVFASAHWRNFSLCRRDNCD
ncbi:MerC domain-containing protein [Opitutia bacterium ISCC 51]|nr:MerC domain-containing protein [Opitutae bacterium ISCC 51]QXD27506.1 MerC domain-containing protein [Opitutae bacterium ISCC 52]